MKLFPGLLLPLIAGLLSVPASSEEAPTSVLQPRDSTNFLSLLNRLHPDNRIGYRLHEQIPLRHGEVPESDGCEGCQSEDAAKELERDFQNRPGVFSHTRKVTEEGWAPMEWVYYFAPRDDGFDVLWVVDTHETGLEEFYSSQQCFRMGGHTNEEWRRTIALTPAFSEYDLWAGLEQEGKDLVSLSRARFEGAWKEIPAQRGRLVYRTPLGAQFEKASGMDSEAVLKALDAKHPGKFPGAVDSGLQCRTNLEGTWVCGLFWEGTTHLSSHHPADCLHATVNLGPIPPHGKRAVRGRIYWMEGTLDTLLDKWNKEFPEN